MRAPATWPRGRASSPPALKATSRPPCIMALVAASIVSSVLPENETASTSVFSPMKFGML